MTGYAVKHSIRAEDIRILMKKLKLTQKDFAKLVNVSQKTIERWESENRDITGPVTTLVHILNEYPQIEENLRVPEKEYPIRLWYMFKSEICTIIDVDERGRKVKIYNIRRILSSFFSWLEDEDYILKSPVRRIHKVKTGTNIKETYSDEALELMRDNCTELRDLAMIDMLASTGMRVGEMVLLNREDIDFNERECVVFGKGDKERIVYFDARTKIHLQNYLNSRKDDNPALFVSLQSPYNRMNIGGIEVRLRQLGKRLGLNKVHPHKFRRTLATMAIDKGMPIEQLQQLLGHRRIDTTLQYAMVKQSNVKIAHRKYIG